jgi:hypothetical protein
MDINDLWSGLLAIYQRAIPAVFLTVALVVAVRLSCRDLSIRRIARSHIEGALASADVKDLAKLVRLLRLSALMPLFLIATFLAYLIIVGDFSAWFAAAIPGPLRTSYTPIDLVAEQRTPEDIAVMAAHLQTRRAHLQTGGPEATRSLNEPQSLPRLYEIMNYHRRERERLFTKYPERYRVDSNETFSVASLYGGFLLLLLLFIAQLILRKWRPSILWFRYTAGWRTLLVILLISLIAGHYRLRWEWSIEGRINSDFRTTAYLLQEEAPITVLEPALLKWVEDEKAKDKPRQFWLARHYDVVTRKLLQRSNRQL